MRPVFLPCGLPELWEIRDREPEARIFAGGTDLFVQSRAGKINISALIGLERIDELKGVRQEGDGLWIGAGTTHAELLAHPLIRRNLSVLAQALDTLGSPLIRNMGTLGGNICTASPAGDTLPPLYALDAGLEFHSPAGRREIPLREFITGPGRTALKQGEILAGIRVKKTADDTLHFFEKVGQRQSLCCAVASLAALFRVSATGIIEEAHLAWGSVAPTVLILPEISASLIGSRPSPAILEEAASRVRQAVSPIDDVRATAAYRRDVSGNLLLRLLPPLMDKARG